jgi:hypothetical protein
MDNFQVLVFRLFEFFVTVISNLFSIIVYIVIRLETKSPEKTKKIYSLIYDNNSKSSKKPVIKKVVKSDDTKTEEDCDPKKQSIIDSLNYLKSKPNKTKQDKESIYSLEMILKNLK